MAKQHVLRARTIARQIASNLEICNGDLVLLKKSDNDHEDIKIFNSLRMALGRSNRKQCVIMFLKDFDDVRIVGEVEMKTYGWRRIEGFLDDADEQSGATDRNTD